PTGSSSRPAPEPPRLRFPVTSVVGLLCGVRASIRVDLHRGSAGSVERDRSNPCQRNERREDRTWLIEVEKRWASVLGNGLVRNVRKRRSSAGRSAPTRPTKRPPSTKPA